MTGSELNRDILDLGYEVTPEVFTVGSAVSHLREKGYLMTEVDVKMLEAKILRERAVFGKTPLSDILKEEEESLKLFKGQSWKILSTLYEGNDEIRRKVDSKLGSVPDTYDSFQVIAEDYYRMRGDHHAEFTSFFYTDSIRVFKTRDIHNYFGMKPQKLQEDFARTSFMPKLRDLPEENRYEREAREEVESWLDSGTLNEVLKGPLPAGIGNDDARILKEISEKVPSDKPTGHVFVILTDDNGLMRSIASVLKTKRWARHQTAVASQMRRNDYTALCLHGVREAYECALQGGREPARVQRLIPYYNYILKRMWYLPEKLVGEIRDMIPGNWRKHVEVQLYYDVPNIERGIERTRYRSETNTITVLRPGCLNRRTVSSIPHTRSWAELPYSQIKQWEDFSISRERVIYAKNIKVGASYTVAAPEKMISTRHITHWLDQAVKPEYSARNEPA
jgi:hypothetical protein